MRQAAGTAGNRLEKQVVVKLMLRVVLVFFKSRLWGTCHHDSVCRQRVHPLVPTYDSDRFRVCVPMVVFERRCRQPNPALHRPASPDICSLHDAVRGVPCVATDLDFRWRTLCRCCATCRYIFGPLQGLGNAIVYGLNKTVKDEYAAHHTHSAVRSRLLVLDLTTYYAARPRLFRYLRICIPHSSRVRKASAVNAEDLKVDCCLNSCSD